MKRIIAYLSLAVLLPVCALAEVFSQEQRQQWLNIAEECKPALSETVVNPVSVVRLTEDSSAFQNWRTEVIGNVEDLYSKSFKSQSGVILDFGKHLTGYFSFSLKPLRSVQDAAIRFKLTFGEVPGDLAIPYDDFSGSLSRGWLQDFIVDVMPGDEYVKIPRRIAARYVKIDLLGSSQYYDFAIDRCGIKALTSAGTSSASVSPDAPQQIREINTVAENTLRECMQTVYEDGPKRDQRLWLGDLYLEALANSVSFRNFDLTKRCLFLFAGLSSDNGLVYSNCFEAPKPHPQKSFLADYALAYNLTLADYFDDTDDIETATGLWPVAKNQIEVLLSSCVNDRNLYDTDLKPEGVPFSAIFFDWTDNLDKNAAIHMMMAYTINRTYELATKIGKESEVGHWPRIVSDMKKAARKEYLDHKTGMIVSGKDRQLSYISQAWAALSGTLSPKEAKDALKSIMTADNAVKPATPYCWHYFLDALVKSGMTREARVVMDDVWGGMVRLGADTFWEAFVPENHLASPYGFAPLNSYCHAWSCTPIYFIQTYKDMFQTNN